jgi:preprotein translocase subunit SecF
MDLFKNTNYDFMKYRKFWVTFSLILVAVGIFSVFVHGKLNIGIDFAGGTQVTLKFTDTPDVDRLRNLLQGAGLSEATIQRFGAPEDNEVMIKTPLLDEAAAGATGAKLEEGSGPVIIAAINRELNAGLAGDAFDLNQNGRDALASKLFELDPDQLRQADEDQARVHYQGVAQAVMDARKERGMFLSLDELSSVAGLSPQAAQALRASTVLGKFAVLGTENVGPQVGKELRSKGVWAVVLSLLGMLVYIWIRFELRFGIGALMASLHDVLVTLGIFALLGFEFNLTTVAAFLTLVGYSVNDTVVIFDRVRENLRKSRRTSLLDLLNQSLNQTLSRTVMTAGTTFLACVTLFLFGGDVIRGFAFVMALGVIVGTYSSLYIASPFALLWEQLFPSEGRAAEGPARAAKPATR